MIIAYIYGAHYVLGPVQTALVTPLILTAAL